MIKRLVLSLTGLPAVRPSSWLAGAAILIGMACTACNRGAEPRDWTLDEVRQLTDVTDKTVSLVRTVSESAEDPSRLEAGISALIKALLSTDRLTRPRSDTVQIRNRLDSYEYAELSACVSARIVIAPMVEVSLREMREGRLEGNEGNDGAISQKQSNLVRFARNNTQCATGLAEFLGSTKSRVAVDALGTAIPEIYASAAAYRAAAGLDLKPLLEDQIAANERIVARLQEACEQSGRRERDAAAGEFRSRCVPYAVALDALPKLRSAVSLLSSNTAKARKAR